jgi:hypothetical protein
VKIFHSPLLISGSPTEYIQAMDKDMHRFDKDMHRFDKDIHRFASTLLIFRTVVIITPLSEGGGI